MKNKAMKLIYKETNMIIEPSGATSVAGLLRTPPNTLKSTVVYMVSGGNVDIHRFPDVFGGVS